MGTRGPQVIVALAAVLEKSPDQGTRMRFLAPAGPEGPRERHEHGRQRGDHRPDAYNAWLSRRNDSEPYSVLTSPKNPVGRTAHAVWGKTPPRWRALCAACCC
jgi:hypothetical protein